MSTLLLQPPPSPLTMPVTQQESSSHSGHGSPGPFIGVMIFMVFVVIAAVVIGRLCSGRTIFGYGRHLDVEGWIERKCHSCIDGRIDPPQRQRPNTAAESVQVPIPVSPPQTEQTDQSAQNPS